jgi:hypothetical protein
MEGSVLPPSKAVDVGCLAQIQNNIMAVQLDCGAQEGHLLTAHDPASQ